MPRTPVVGDHYEEDEVAKLKDGRHIAMGKSWIHVTGQTGSGNANVINVRVPGLREIEHILNVQFYTDPITFSEDGLNPVNKKITGNVVGMTIYGIAAATTLTAEVIAIGPP